MMHPSVPPSCRAIRSVALHRDLPTVPGASTRALAFGLSFSSLALALRAEKDQPALPPNPGTSTPDQLAQPTPAPLALGTVPAPARGRGELFFIDAAVADPRAFWLAAPAGATVVAIPADVDSWEFMATEAARFRDLGAIHLVSHGEPGSLVLNGHRTTAADLAPRAALLRRLGSALSKNGDILLYGCDTGTGDAGRLLVTRLADFTGSDVAASANPTGTRPDADWTLEITRGLIETPTSVPADYSHTLATFSVSTISALRTALSTAATNNAVDTITLTANITAASASDVVTGPDTKPTFVVINNTDGQILTIVGGGFSLDAGHFGRALYVQAGTVDISNLTITKGLLSGNGGNTAGSAENLALGAGLYNAGTVTLSGVTLTANKSSGGGGGGGTATPNLGGCGAGGGGGGFGGIGGGTGGSGKNSSGVIAGTYVGVACSGGTGGRGGSFNGVQLCGFGGSTNGGSGGSYGGYSTGGAGGRANNGTISIGGGGGGSGYNATGGSGGNAAGGVFNSGTLTLIGSSVVSNNLGAGGGGGGGGATGQSGNGGASGKGVGAFWNTGTLRMTSAVFSGLNGNAAASGAGGFAPGATTGTVPAAVNDIHNLGTLDTAYVVADTTPPTVLSIVRRLPSTAQATTSTSATFRVTFSEAVNTPATSNFAVTAVNSSSIVGTIASVTPVSALIYDVAVTLTSGSGE
ncbi:MAG: DUF4347 domain-containing protein, partial [Verrucomicrobia bacterium]|nr:DUF4347 domain-containing protein [Verrucomicrobiota bacterium]